MVKYIQSNNHSHKDSDGNYFHIECYRESAVGASRYGRLDVLLPESVSSKPRASNETRMPPLQGATLLEVSERFPLYFLRGNQGGTANRIRP